MKKNFGIINSLVFFLLFSSLFSFGGCKNNLQKMMNDYNSQYTPTEDPRVPPKPGDPDFKASTMLSSKYPVTLDSSVNITGPFGCTSYLWIITDKFGENRSDDITFYEGSGTNCREFRFYVPDSNLTKGTYKIKLIVTDAKNNEYVDTAALIIYEEI